MKISVTRHNEVNPSELPMLFKAGARLVKSEYANGVIIGKYVSNGKEVFAYSDDEIVVHNVRLPLSVNGTYDCEVDIVM